MREFMTSDGLRDVFVERIVPEMKESVFSKVGDRRVQGSINDLVYCAKVMLIQQERSPSMSQCR